MITLTYFFDVFYGQFTIAVAWGGGTSILGHTGCAWFGSPFQLKFLNWVEEFVRNS